MSIQFLIGRSGSGKSTWMREQVKQQLEQEPKGDPIIFLVPDQMSFQIEYDISSTPALKGMLRAQVLSFSRMAYRILQEVGGIANVPIDQVGVTMLLRKIVEEHRSDLRVFQRSADQFGFLEQLEQMMTELKRYQVNFDQLQEEEVGTNPLLQDKCHDLQLIFERLQQALWGQYVDAEDTMRLLAEKLPFSDYIRKASIYVDGFHQFTPQERDVIRALMKTCRQMTISLTLDPAVAQRREIPDETALFYPTAQTHQQLLDIVAEEQLTLRETIFFEEGRRHQCVSALHHLEQGFDHSPPPPFTETVEDQIELSAAVNRRAEVEHMARQMLSLVRDKGYRWRDIVVLTRDLSLYHDVIENVFAEYDMPVFVDQKKTMLHHPIVECIRSTLDVINQNWRYDAVFRCVKTDLLYQWENEADLLEKREAFDQLENYVLAHGINGNKWKQEDVWQGLTYRSLEEEHDAVFDDEEEQRQRKALRDQIVTPISALEQRLRQAPHVRAMCAALFQYLEDIQVPRKMALWKSQAEAQGNLRLAREHDQVWGAIMDLLDQLVEMMGDEHISLELFAQFMESGCERLRFAHVPPAIDQVVVGDMERSRFSDSKVVFLMGVNDGVLPARTEEEGIVTDDEREWLSEAGMGLAPCQKEKLALETFGFYLAVCAPSERLFVSYALADAEGKSLQPSIFLRKITSLFPELTEQLAVQDPYEQAEAEQLAFIQRPFKTLSSLTSVLRHWQKGYPLAPFWWDAYNWLVKDEHWRDEARRTLKSLFYRNEAKPLKRETSKQLYGDRIRASVSRMEKFQACPFSQFLSHGLRLKERRVFRLEAPDIGQLFHAALKKIDDQLRYSKRQWHELSKDECRTLAKEVVEQIAPRLQGNILLSSHRHQYIKRKLQQVVERASDVLHEHAKGSQFYPIGMEVGFGPGEALPPLHFTLPNGVSMEVIGRIDRVDRAEEAGHLYLRVIDYKSSQRDVDLSEVYYGMSLQMLMYLDVIITYAERWLGQQAEAAGVLYFHIHNPILNKTGPVPQDVVDQELYRQFKMKGLVLADEDVVRSMDTTLDTQYSDVIPVALKKDGSFYSNSKVASREEFDYLRAFVRQQVEDIGIKITNGDIDIAPYQYKQRTPCTFCSFKSVCQYDQTLEENQYDTKRPLSRQGIMDSLRQATEQHTESTGDVSVRRRES
ncbi:helicase-exonuclease AddAB subunit AddB [Caldalkalibacillus salinus]|uniref:helicase-exonuclease AddAB subunit AddB n=1 Tax=Caldalkalibacillus salinus TaxID=2803787 RepID=UPI0019233AFD|nr:helicase-exonuclease AddAB subunit AddB [Caldalkalibacillus salinus]